MTSNDIVNWGESWYEFKFYGYRKGFCTYKMLQDEYEGFVKEFNEKKRTLTKLGFKDVHSYIMAVLAYNN